MLPGRDVFQAQAQTIEQSIAAEVMASGTYRPASRFWVMP